MPYLKPVLVIDVVPTKQAAIIIFRFLPKVRSMNQKQTNVETKVQIEKLGFESTSKGMAGPGLAEPSRESSESKAPPDAWDLEARCPQDLELKAPLAPACLEPDCKAKVKRIRANHILNAKENIQATFILLSHVKHR